MSVSFAALSPPFVCPSERYIAHRVSFPLSPRSFIVSGFLRSFMPLFLFSSRRFSIGYIRSTSDTTPVSRSLQDRRLAATSVKQDRTDVWTDGRFPFFFFFSWLVRALQLFVTGCLRAIGYRCLFFLPLVQRIKIPVLRPDIYPIGECRLASWRRSRRNGPSCLKTAHWVPSFLLLLPKFTKANVSWLERFALPITRPLRSGAHQKRNLRIRASSLRIQNTFYAYSLTPFLIICFT